jgi:hypothetical protein
VGDFIYIFIILICDMKYLSIIFIASIWAGSAWAGTLTIKPNASPTPDQEAIVARALSGDYKGASFTIGTADLNGDGRPDLIVHFTSNEWCSPSGQGCEGIVILSEAEGYDNHYAALPLFGDVVKVHTTIHHGLYDLSFDGSKRVFKFDGKNYK